MDYRQKPDRMEGRGAHITTDITHSKVRVHEGKDNMQKTQYNKSDEALYSCKISLQRPTFLRLYV